MKNVFTLTSENLTNAGGPMGNNSTWDNWSKLYSTVEKAQAAAEKDYKEQGGKTKIIWSPRNNGSISQDLLFVMYTITESPID